MEKKESKLTFCQVSRVICFILILVGIMFGASFMLMPKNNTEDSGMFNPNAHGFYGEPKDTLEIAIIGNSDAYSGLSPLELWKDHGYTAILAGEGSQALSGSVIMLKDILERQNPKLIILETDAVFSGLPHNTFVSIVKERLPLFQYHDRWKSVRADEMLKKPSYTHKTVTKGQYVSSEVVPYIGPEYMIESKNEKNIPWYSKVFLDQFVKICKDNNIPLLLVHVPSKTSWNYEKHNAMEDYAKKQELNFVDFDINRGQYGFDWETDTRDGGRHLNCSGAKKITEYLGKYIAHNYNLTDYRGNSEYTEWDENYTKYAKMIGK